MNLTGEFRRLTAAEERELAMRRPRIRPPRSPDRASVGHATRELHGSPAWGEWLASDARAALIESNIPWALKLAGCRRFDRLGEDRFSVALLALCEAVDQFDPGRGRLTTFATIFCRQRLCRAVMTDLPTIDVPVHVQEYMRALDEGRRPPKKSPATVRHVPDGRRALAVRRLRGNRRTRSGGSDLGDHLDEIPDHREAAPPESGAWSAEWVAAAVDGLPPYLADLVRRLHFSGDRPPTQRQIAREAGVTDQAIHQRLGLAYHKLREALARPAPARPAPASGPRPAERALLEAAVAIRAEGAPMTYAELGRRSRLGGNYAFHIVRRLKARRADLWPWEVAAEDGRSASTSGPGGLR